MQLHSGLRPEPLVLKISGQVPTLPHPLTLQVDANGWLNTDLADGEYAINSADNLFFWRSNNQIISFDLIQLLITVNSLIGSSHAPVTVVNSTSIQFTLTSQQITAIALAAGIDHNSLNNLVVGNPHTQYALIGTVVTSVTASLPLSSSGGLTPDISISDPDSTHKGAVPMGGTPATNVYLCATQTTGAISFQQIAYSDLSGLPTIPAAQIQSDWTQANNLLADYIKNKPTISGSNTGDQVGDGVTITGTGTLADPFVAVGGSPGAGEIWTSLTGTYASDTTFTFTGTDKDCGLILLSLFTCTNAAGTKRRIGYVSSVVNSNPGGSGTITATVVTETDLLVDDIDFKVSYDRKVTDYIFRITIPGEVIADASYPQGTYMSDIITAKYMLPLDIAVLTAAAGAGASCTTNVYRGTVSMFASAPDLTTNSYLRGQRPHKDGTSSTTRFDITNPVGTTFRYTFDGTGTDPNYTSTNPNIGDTVIINGQNFNANNNGTFVITASGANYFEVTNAAGVAENDKTIGTGYLRIYGLSACSLSLGDNLTLRIPSSAGATNKAQNYQAKIYVVPQLIYTAF